MSREKSVTLAVFLLETNRFADKKESEIKEFTCRENN